MSNATGTATIRPEEAAHFGKLAAEWWDPKGSSAMLHKLNPVRLAFLREAIDSHFGADPKTLRPLAGRTALDVGCGAGLLAEPLARMGATVTAVDAAEENIAAAKAHAAGSGLLRTPLPFRGGAGGGGSPADAASAFPQAGTIEYHHGELAALGLGQFDLVTSMEVIEHVADKPAFIAGLVERVADNGLLVLSTPNRTTPSRLLLVGAAETVGMVPKGTHHWEDFITPLELSDLLADAGFAMGNPKGISWSPFKGLHLSDDLSLNYIVTAKRA